MSDYESITGKRIKYLTSDPTLSSSYEGQVWYNSTTGVNKSLVQIKAWSSSGNMGTARYLIGSCGSQTAALGFGGYSGGVKNETEEYNGFNWSNGGNIGTARYNPGGAGSQTAGLAFGGFTSTKVNNVEEYDGSSWTAQNTMPTAVRNPAGSGTQTAGLSSGGNSPGGITGVTQEYDGTNWTTSPGSMNVARENATGFGIQTATIVAGGYEPGVNNAEQYNGSTWTAISDLNSPVYSLASAANGTTSHGITFGGASPAGTGLTQTEEWDGTSWTISSATLAAGKWKLGGAGTASAGLKFAGGPPPSGNVATEEYNSNINAITQASWASGGTQNTSRVYSGGSGPVNSALIINGFVGSGLGGFNDAAETYNGTSFSNITNFPYNAVGTFGLGDAEAFIGGAGYKNDASHVNTTAEYDGSSWTSGGNVNEVGQAAGGTGTQTAGIIGNRSTSPSAQAEEYDGSSWTSTPNTNVAGAGGNGMAGTQTAALIYGASPTPLYDRTESWNGSAWTNVSALSTGRRSGSMGGSQTAALFGGGNVNPPTSNTAQTELYNGTSWATSANMATARFYQRGGSHTAADNQLATSGSPNGSTISAATEEFTAGTSVITARTLTTS